MLEYCDRWTQSFEFPGGVSSRQSYVQLDRQFFPGDLVLHWVEELVIFVFD
jgi:hypothetical protein